MDQATRITRQEASRQADATRKPKITLGKTTITVKKPITLRDRVLAAKKAQRFAQEKATRLAARAEELAKAGDPRASKIAALAEKATSKLGDANAKMETLFGAVKKRADHDGAKMAEMAIRLHYLKDGLKRRGQGGDLAWDAKNIARYEKDIAKQEEQLKAAQSKAKQYEARYESIMPGVSGLTATAAESQMEKFIADQGAAYKASPGDNEPPPKMADLNQAIGLPPGGSAALATQESSEGEPALYGKSASRAGEQEFGAKNTSGPELAAGPTKSKSNIPTSGGTKNKPQLKQGDQGGWYYETGAGSKVYVQK